MRDAADRVIVCLGFTLPVVLLATVPAVQYPLWQWTAMVLATPVATWGAWPLYRAAAAGVARGEAAPQLPAALAVAVSYGWSVWAMVGTDAGATAHVHAFSPFGFQPNGYAQIFFEVAAGVTTCVLAADGLCARIRVHVAGAQPLVEPGAGRADAAVAAGVVLLAGLTAGFRLGAGGSVGLQDSGSAAVAATCAVLACAAPSAFALVRWSAAQAAAVAGRPLGVLAARPSALRAAIVVDTVVLDLAELSSAPSRVVAAEVLDDDAPALAAALAAHSAHPGARAVEGYAAAAFQPAVHDVRTGDGVDVTASTGARSVTLTGRGSDVTLTADGVALAVFHLSSGPPDAQAVAAFRALGVEPVLLTSADAATASRAATAADIDVVVPDAVAAGRVQVVARLREDGRRVLLLGEPAGADLETGTDIALDPSAGQARAAATAVGLLRRTATVLAVDGVALWAFTLVAALAAAGGYLHALLTALAALAVTVAVVAHAVTLRRWSPSRSPVENDVAVIDEAG